MFLPMNFREINHKRKDSIPTRGREGIFDHIISRLTSDNVGTLSDISIAIWLRISIIGRRKLIKVSTAYDLCFPLVNRFHARPELISQSL